MNTKLFEFIGRDNGGHHPAAGKDYQLATRPATAAWLDAMVLRGTLCITVSNTSKVQGGRRPQEQR
jgi:hypothetical protein